MRGPTIIKAWGGFLDDELDTFGLGDCLQLSIWKTRSEAQKRYEDVRRVEIKIAPRRRLTRRQAPSE